MLESKKRILRAAGYGYEVDRAERGLCPTCGKTIGEFKDALSKKEFTISGMCQLCQDGVFN